MDYLSALERAIVYIEGHLEGDVAAQEVARAAGYSYYHLTRQFSAVLGESVGGYIKKRRLASAAKQLIYTDRRIIDIALNHGFGSSEAFSRAFKAAYRFSPSAYRANRLDAVIGAKEALVPELLNHHARHITVHPRIVEMDAVRVVGLRGRTTLRDNEIPQLWQRFLEVEGIVPRRTPGGRGFGICEACESNTLYTMNDDALFSEVVGAEVDEIGDIPAPLTAKVIPGGRYAVFTHTGGIDTLKKTYNYIWGTWFLGTKEEVDGRDDFELYDGRFLGRDCPASEIDLYIPIK